MARRSSIRAGYWLTLSLLAALLLPQCQQAPRTAEERGGRLFVRSCSGCHGVDGRGGRRVGLNARSRDLTDPAFHSSVSDETLRKTIRNGKGAMPAFGALLEPKELDDLVLFLRSLPKRASTAR